MIKIFLFSLWKSFSNILVIFVCSMTKHKDKLFMAANCSNQGLSYYPYFYELGWKWNCTGCIRMSIQFYNNSKISSFGLFTSDVLLLPLCKLPCLSCALKFWEKCTIHIVSSEMTSFYIFWKLYLCILIKYWKC